MKAIIEKVRRRSILAALEAKADLAWKSGAFQHVVINPDLIVSVTSHKKRFGTLHKTLRCLLMQEVGPAATELWIAAEDEASLPIEVLELQNHGLTICVEADASLRSFMKLIPAREKHPDKYIVTADDDVYYWRSWLRDLVYALSPYPEVVLCHRAHEMLFRADGKFLPYGSWGIETASQELSLYHMPTGHGGVMYPPHIFHKDALKRDLAKLLCPTGDDIWFWWMGALNGAVFKQVGPRRYWYTWRNSQSAGLMHHNVYTERPANDVMIDAMISHYGLPTQATLSRSINGFGNT